MISGVNVLDLRQSNRGLLLREIILRGQVTRRELQQRTGLSAASIANLVTELRNEGLVLEAGSLPSRGGRPLGLITPAPAGAYSIGVEVGDTHVTADLYDLALTRRDRVRTPVPGAVPDPDVVREAVTSAVDTLRDRHADTDERLLGVGLGVPGTVETTPAGHSVIYAADLDWDGLPVRNLYRDPEIPVHAGNGAQTQATAEMWRGGARGVDHCVVALVGDGVGAGLVVNGSLLEGASGSAGEWGHTKVAVDGPPCDCGSRGCLEAYVGGRSIARRWRGGNADGTVVRDLIAATDAGDVEAGAVLDDVLRALAAGIASLVNLLNPQKVIIGGWAGLELTASRLPLLADYVEQGALSRATERLTIERSELAEGAVSLGAALLPIASTVERTLMKHGVSR